MRSNLSPCSNGRKASWLKKRQRRSRDGPNVATPFPVGQEGEVLPEGNFVAAVYPGGKSADILYLMENNLTLTAAEGCTGRNQKGGGGVGWWDNRGGGRGGEYLGPWYAWQRVREHHIRPGKTWRCEGGVFFPPATPTLLGRQRRWWRHQWQWRAPEEMEEGMPTDTRTPPYPFMGPICPYTYITLTLRGQRTCRDC